MAHFSIISAYIRPEINERISIGLLLIGKDDVYINFSDSKTKLLKELLSKDKYSYLKSTISQIKRESKSISSNPDDYLSLFDFDKKDNTFFDASYLRYLNIYSNTLFHFSDLKIIDDSFFNQKMFENLFVKYIDNRLYEVIIKETNKLDIIETVYPRIEKFYSIKKEITPSIVPNLTMPIKIDIIGKNERPVYAQSVDLTKTNYHIQNDLSSIMMLNNAYSKNAQAFIISSEPEKDNKLQHDIWENLRNGQIAEYVDISEIAKIEEYAKRHGVTPLV